jgi:diguanylate cyclase (GGDEF)-like protein
MPDSKIAQLRDNCERLLAQLVESQLNRLPMQDRLGERVSAASAQRYLTEEQFVPGTASAPVEIPAEVPAEAHEYARRLGERFALSQRAVEDLISQLLRACQPSGRISQRQLNQQVDLLTAGVKAYLNAVIQPLKEQAHQDGLTGLLNRAFFDQRLGEELTRAQRYQREFALVLFDLDQFKTINDQFGHPTGDAVLQRFAAFLRSSLRQTDSAFRYGGDEFAALLPETGNLAAHYVLERLEQRWLEECRRELSPRSVMVSYGLAAYPQDGVNAVELIKLADMHLYEHKRTRQHKFKSPQVTEV